MNYNDNMSLDKLSKEIQQLTFDALKEKFKSRIKESFLIDVLIQIESEMGPNITSYFHDPNSTTMSDILIRPETHPEYDICRMVVGCHRANKIFLKDDERGEKQNNSEYKESLVNQVIEHIKLRKYGSVYFRKLQLIQGDEFLYFPVPYKLFVMVVHSFELIHNLQFKRKEFYISIFNKSCAALTLLENNFMDSAYSLVRGVIEVFLKLKCSDSEQTIDECDKFTKWDVEKTATRHYPKEFNEQFNKRTSQTKCKKIDYLHYGWVDKIQDYHEIKFEKPYSVNGLFNYLIETSDTIKMSELFTTLKDLYNQCHGFVHGNIGNDGIPLFHYFQISIALFIVVFGSYQLLCDDCKVTTDINGVNVIKSINRDYKQLVDQYNKRSTENFEQYYKMK